MCDNAPNCARGMPACKYSPLHQARTKCEPATCWVLSVQKLLSMHVCMCATLHTFPCVQALLCAAVRAIVCVVSRAERAGSGRKGAASWGLLCASAAVTKAGSRRTCLPHPPHHFRAVLSSAYLRALQMNFQLANREASRRWHLQRSYTRSLAGGK
jgi:hypothetical protein